MFCSMKVRILCIFVLISLVHLSNADNDTINVLKRIQKQLSEFKRKYENEQQRIRDVVSLSVRDFQDEPCFNATIGMFMHKNDNDPFGNIHIAIIELDVATLLSDTGKLSESAVGIVEKQGCECEKACEVIRQDMANHTDVQTNQLTDELKAQFETQTKSYEEASKKIGNTHQNMLDSLSKSQEIRNKLDSLENLTLSQYNSFDDLATRLSNELKKQFETQTTSVQMCMSNLCTDCDCVIASGNGPGVYPILIFNKVTSVYCDAFGKMMIQHQMAGPATFFDRIWYDFKNGFGSPNAQFWMGLEYIRLLTYLRRYELHIVLVDFKNVTTHVIYDDFKIGDESDFYRMNKLGAFSGDEAVNMLQSHINMPFSTVDKSSEQNNIDCASKYESGWWYFDNNLFEDNCSFANLNKRVGKNDNEVTNNVLNWDGKVLKEVSMYIKLH